jgi:hypothetical protein
MMAHAVIVFDAVAQQHLGAFLGGFPPGRYTPLGWLAAEVGEKPVGLVQDVALLLQRHISGVLVRVAVQADLVAGIPDHGAFLGEGLQAVARDKPRCLDVVLLQELEQASGADCACEKTCSLCSEERRRKGQETKTLAKGRNIGFPKEITGDAYLD